MKFARRSRQDIDVNLTPLIDVVFLLLIFFMVSTTFTKESRIGINLPKAERDVEATSVPQSIEIVIDAQGNYSVDGVRLVNNSVLSLRAALNAFLVDEMPAVIVTADAQAAHQHVVTAMDVAGQLGFNKLKISTLKRAQQ